MAKNLPYFKFYTNEWLTGEVTLCSLEAQGVFVNLCALYWSKQGVLSLTSVIRRYNERNIQELISEGIIQSDQEHIVIRFLDQQFGERDKLSEQNRQNVLKRHNKVTSVLPGSTSVSDANTSVYNKEEKRREEKRKEEKRGEVKAQAPLTPTPKEKVKKEIFKRPSIDELKDYFFLKLQEKKTGDQEAEKFYDFYESKGWMVGKNKMKNWKSSINNWLRKDNLSKDKNGTDKFSPEAVKSRMERW